MCCVEARPHFRLISIEAWFDLQQHFSSSIQLSAAACERKFLKKRAMCNLRWIIGSWGQLSKEHTACMVLALKLRLKYGSLFDKFVDLSSITEEESGRNMPISPLKSRHGHRKIDFKSSDSQNIRGSGSSKCCAFRIASLKISCRCRLLILPHCVSRGVLIFSFVEL